MNKKDLIKCVEQSIWVQFSGTGLLQNSSKISLNQDITFKKNGSAIQVQYHHNAQAVTLDEFSNEVLASAAFTRLQVVIRRYTRYRCFAKCVKNIVKWGVAPAAVFVFALAINMAMTKRMGTSVSIASPALALPSADMSILQSADAQVAPVKRHSDLATAIADGVKAGKYSVQLSRGKKGTLYVFSDPTCQHCKLLEPELEKLSHDYTIQVFPVSVFGGQSSIDRVAQVLCQKPGIRKAVWKKAVAGEDVVVATFENGVAVIPSVCQEGYTAIEANDKIFKAMNFVGTPTIINAFGEQLPDALPNTELAIRHWMESAGQ